MNVLINVLIGSIPEILYFWLFITTVFNIKEKRIILLLELTIIYIITIIIKPYQLIYYIIFIISQYIALKTVSNRKVTIPDAFIIAIGFIYLIVVYLISYLFSDGLYSNYYMSVILSRILLFMPFIFKSKMKNIYEKYRILWDKPRTLEEKRKIKSITLRSICLILTFAVIYLVYILAINILKSFS